MEGGEIPGGSQRCRPFSRVHLIAFHNAPKCLGCVEDFFNSYYDGSKASNALKRFMPSIHCHLKKKKIYRGQIRSTSMARVEGERGPGTTGWICRNTGKRAGSTYAACQGTSYCCGDIRGVDWVCFHTPTDSNADLRHAKSHTSEVFTIKHFRGTMCSL